MDAQQCFEENTVITFDTFYYSLHLLYGISQLGHTYSHTHAHTHRHSCTHTYRERERCTHTHTHTQSVQDSEVFIVN